MPNDLFIPPYSTGDPRLKRRINHDSRSARYRLDTSGASIVDVSWPMHFADGMLDQGDVGACTAETGTEIMGSDPFYRTLPSYISLAVIAGTQTWPLALYHDETVADDYPGTYPPDDTGSDGLTLGKVLTARGMIAGYQHTFTAEDALKGMRTNGPFAWGTNWKTGMDAVNEDTGEVKYTGTVRGGHELCGFKIDVENERMWFHNHWGAWGYKRSGIAWISFDGFAQSLADQGDVTFMVPLSSFPPIPDPTPGESMSAQELATDLGTWLTRKRPSIGASSARRTVQTFLSSNGVKW